MCALFVAPRVTHRRGQIYNGRLRGFGDCGEVEKGVPPKSVAERCEEAQNNYSSTIHALVSAVKKLQAPIQKSSLHALYIPEVPLCSEFARALTFGTCSAEAREGMALSRAQRRAAAACLPHERLC